MRIYLVRHGQTQVAANGTYGPSAPLTELGRAQAARVAAALASVRITSVVCSPAVRAMQTALPLQQALRLDPLVLPGLIEIDIGRLASGVEPYEPRLVNGQVLSDFSHIGGESFEVFSRRVLAGFAELLSAHHHDDAVAVFTHGGVKNVLIDHCAGRDLSPTLRTLFGNGSISSVDALGDGFTVHTVNDVTHLRPSQ